jgi:hypothetical protein
MGAAVAIRISARREAVSMAVSVRSAHRKAVDLPIAGVSLAPYDRSASLE